MFWEIEKILPLQVPEPFPLPLSRESEDLDVLGDLENFTIASMRTPPPILLAILSVGVCEYEGNKPMNQVVEDTVACT